MDKPAWMWVAFIGIVIVLLAIDLGLFNRKDHVIGVRESLLLSAFYIVIALLFGGWIWHTLGTQSAEEYLTGYLVEKSLSIDNIFVISVIFSFLHIPRIYQHRVLFWGILGVIVFRAIMIGFGAVLIEQYHWVLYIFGAFLVYTGIKMFFINHEEMHLEDNKMIKFLKSHFPITHELHGNHFFIRKKHGKKSKIYLTPLMLALMIIEIIDVMFAVDSVPAIFALTTDPYIVYTSNIFAILGLRSLYFALSAILHRFVYLRYGLALVLVFIGSKIFIADLFKWEKFPTSVSLIITVGIIAVSVIFSLIKTRNDKMDYK